MTKIVLIILVCVTNTLFAQQLDTLEVNQQDNVKLMITVTK